MSIDITLPAKVWNSPFKLLAYCFRCQGHRVFVNYLTRFRWQFIFRYFNNFSRPSQTNLPTNTVNMMKTLKLLSYYGSQSFLTLYPFDKSSKIKFNQ